MFVCRLFDLDMILFSIANGFVCVIWLVWAMGTESGQGVVNVMGYGT